jgi:hypothetical protein
MADGLCRYYRLIKKVVDWYQLWRDSTMRNFEQAIYPVTPYCEYLATSYLIDKNKKKLNKR